MNLNKTDFVVIGACILSLIFFLIDTVLDSVIPIYINAVIILGVFLYWSLRKDVAPPLRKSLIIGSVSGILYTFLDNIFVNASIIMYLRSEDIEVYGTPVSVIITWMYSIPIALYFYQRLRSSFDEFYISSALTGAGASLSAILFDYLGGKARLWVWLWNTNTMPSRPPYIISTPMFVPVALFITFFLSPWIIGGQRFTSLNIGFSSNPLVGGVRCSVILGTAMYLSFRIFSF